MVAQRGTDVVLDIGALERAIADHRLQAGVTGQQSAKPRPAPICKGMTCTCLVFAAFFLAGGAAMIAVHVTHEATSLTLSEVYSIPTSAIGACLVAFAGLLILLAVFNYWRHRTL